MSKSSNDCLFYHILPVSFGVFYSYQHVERLYLGSILASFSSLCNKRGSTAEILLVILIQIASKKRAGKLPLTHTQECLYKTECYKAKQRERNKCLKPKRPQLPTSATGSISCPWVETRPKPSVGVPAGEWLCCTRSGRLTWPAKPLLAGWPERLWSPDVCRDTSHMEKKRRRNCRRKQKNTTQGCHINPHS